MNIVFCGGGTAGHVTPNIALINNLTYDCYYIGTNGMEKQLIEPLVGKKVRKYFTVSAHKLKRSFSLDNLLLPFRLMQSVKQCKTVLKQLQPFVLFSKGGYAAFPVVLAAKKLNADIIVYESDTSLGLANKLSLPFATEKLCAFENKSDMKRVGMLLRKDIASGNKRLGLSAMGFSGKKPIVLVTGGSLGAQALNVCIEKCERLFDSFDVFVLTGKNKRIYSDYVRQAEYVDNIADVYAACDFAVTRGGATTLAELTKCRIPFVCVPLEKASRGEQLTNARLFCEKQGCGICLRESSLNENSLTDALSELLRHKNPYHKRQTEFSVEIDGTDRTLEIINGLAAKIPKHD